MLFNGFKGEVELAFMGHEAGGVADDADDGAAAGVDCSAPMMNIDEDGGKRKRTEIFSAKRPKFIPFVESLSRYSHQPSSS